MTEPAMPEAITAPPELVPFTLVRYQRQEALVYLPENQASGPELKSRVLALQYDAEFQNDRDCPADVTVHELEG